MNGAFLFYTDNKAAVFPTECSLSHHGRQGAKLCRMPLFIILLFFAVRSA